MIQAFADVDPVQAATEWPFVCPEHLERARHALGLLATGAGQEVAGQDLRLVGASKPNGAGGRSGAGKSAGTDEGSRPSSLVTAYRQLFVGPNHLVAPPWGSVYTDRDCVVFGASTLELRAWMRENGIHMDTGASEPEDHLGLLLQQMAFLAANKPHLLDDFLRLHVLTWSHHYLEELAEAAAGIAGFYEGLALLTDLTLENLREKRNLNVKYPRFYR